MVTEGYKKNILNLVLLILIMKKLKKYVDDNNSEQFQEWYDTQTKT